MTSDRIPIACSLAPDRAQDQLGEWAELRRRATSVEQLDTGVRIMAPAELAEQVRDLARREAACCAFLDIATAVRDGSVVVTITSPDPAAGPVIQLLAGCT